MTFALGLLLVASLAWCGLDVARKVLGTKLGALPLLVALSVGHAAVLAAGLALTGWPAIAPGFYLPAAGSVALNIAGNLLFLRAVTVSPFATVMPLLSLVPVGATLAAWLVLGEVPSLQQGSGIALIVAAAWVIAKPAEGKLGGEPGVWPMFAVAGCWALVASCDKAASGASSPAFHALTIYAGMAAVLLPVLVWRRTPLTAAPGTVPWLVFGIAAGLLAIVTQFAAMQDLLVGLVEAVKRMVGLVVAVLVGRFAFGEPVGPARLAAIAAMGVGTALLLL